MSILSVDQISPIGSGTTITLNATEVKTGTEITVGTGASIFSPAGNTLTFGTNNVERIRIKNDGKVGINTSNTSNAKLEISDRSTGTFSGLAVGTQYGTSLFGGYNNYPAIMNSNQQPLIYCDTNNDRTELFGDTVGFGTTCAFRVNNAERLRIGSAGQIGLAGANYGTSGQVLTSQGSGSAPTWATPSSGLSDFDTWYLTADTVGNTNPLVNNWSRWTNHGGTGSVTFAAPSSGIWTFPSTGYWLIDFTGRFVVTNATERGCNIGMYVTTNNSYYAFVSQSSCNMGVSHASGTKGHTKINYIFDVTDTSTHKIKLSSGYQQVVGTLSGHGAYLYTNVKFIKLRDT